jgi:hypothetical protein
MLASPRGIEAILGIAAAVHDERVVERADLQRPRRKRRRWRFPHHDSSDDDDAKHNGEDQAQYPADSPSSARRLADGGIAGPNSHASIMAGGDTLEESSRRVARATGGSHSCGRLGGGCRTASPLANEARVTLGRPRLPAQPVPSLPGLSRGRSHRRATSVPFTAVVTGPERTPTDNATVAATCAVRHPTR